jgi:hypothetical protein
MVAKSAAAKVETVEEVVEAPGAISHTPTPATTDPATAEEQEPVEVVEATTKRGIPNNTWTLQYGKHRLDLVEGQSTDMPIDVYEYLKRQGNLVARL